MRESNVEKTSQVSYAYADLGEKIQKAMDTAALINKRERLLKWKVTEYVELEKLQKQFQPYNRAWQLSNDFQMITQCMEGPLNSVNREQLTDDVLNSWNELNKLYDLGGGWGWVG